MRGSTLPVQDAKYVRREAGGGGGTSLLLTLMYRRTLEHARGTNDGA